MLYDAVRNLPYMRGLRFRSSALVCVPLQRVAIARALLKNAPIAVFDEATSSLDSQTEAVVQSSIATLRRGRTVLIIAHRLSTVRDADEILVLHEGSIVERGTHDALIALHGRYFASWDAQTRDTKAGGVDAESGVAQLAVPHHTTLVATQDQRSDETALPIVPTPVTTADTSQ